MRKFFKEFKAFITRGNVIDMAVGVIVGGAFTAIVTALTNQIFKPLVNWALSGADGGLEQAVTMLKVVRDDTGAIDMTKSIYIDWGAFITAVLNFFIIAFILFAIVKAINVARGVAEESVKAKYCGYSRDEYYEMRLSGMNKKQIKAAAVECDRLAAEKAAEEAEAAANAPAPETQEDILRDIRELLKANACRDDAEIDKK